MRWTSTCARARACIRHHTSETPRHLGTSGCLRLPACLAPQGKLCGPRVGSRESPAAHAWAAGQVLQPTHTRRVASGQSPKPRCFGSHFRGFDVLLGAGRQSEVVSVLGVSVQDSARGPAWTVCACAPLPGRGAVPHYAKDSPHVRGREAHQFAVAGEFSARSPSARTRHPCRHARTDTAPAPRSSVRGPSSPLALAQQARGTRARAAANLAREHARAESDRHRRSPGRQCSWPAPSPPSPSPAPLGARPASG